MHHGLWTSVADAPAHTNAKELMAFLIFLRDFLPLCDATLSLWRTDSSTLMAYIRREGGMVSLLLHLARQIILAHQRQIRILPVFVSSEENHLADAASRFQTLPDWSVPTEIFRRMVCRWSLLDINLIATSALNLRFFVWGDAPEAEALDALAQLWNYRLAYAFSPLLRVIWKIAVHRRLPPSNVLLARPEMVSGGPGAPGHGHARSDRPHVGPSSYLIFLYSFGGFLEASRTQSRTPPSATFPAVGVPLQQRDTTPSGALSRTFSVPAKFSSPSI